MISEGVRVPSFTLPAALGDTLARFDSSEVVGRTVTLLAFYPGDFDEPCTEFLRTLSDLARSELGRSVATVGLSTDTAYSHRAFAREYDIAFPLCSDNDGSVAERYGVLHDEFDGHRRLARRAVFLLDAEGVVRHRWVAEDPADLPAFEELRERAAGLVDEGSTGNEEPAGDEGSTDRHYARAHDL